MKTILITGISGFVGGHYTAFLMRQRRNWIIHGISRSKPDWDFISNGDEISDTINFHQVNLLDSDKVHQIIKEINPDYILHLAAFSSVAESWQKPVASFLNNTNAFLNVIESVRLNAIDCKILSVGSSEEYGLIKPDTLPLREDIRPCPANPYAVARTSQESLAQIYVKGYHLDICCTRSFNHIGPGQREYFVVSSIAQQFADIVGGRKDPVVNIGNGNIIRDFIDIDDVIRAYDAIFIQGITGETYNVCSGEGHSINEIVRMYSEILEIPVQIIQQISMLRPIDNPILVGTYEKLFTHTGWKPQVSIKESLEKIYSYWKKKRNY